MFAPFFGKVGGGEVGVKATGFRWGGGWRRLAPKLFIHLASLEQHKN